MEVSDVASKRVLFLTKITVYFLFPPQDDYTRSVKTTNANGNGMFMLLGTSNKFVEMAELVFSSATKSTDNNGEMIHDRLPQETRTGSVVER